MPGTALGTRDMAVNKTQNSKTESGSSQSTAHPLPPTHASHSPQFFVVKRLNDSSKFIRIRSDGRERKISGCPAYKSTSLSESSLDLFYFYRCHCHSMSRDYLSLEIAFISIWGGDCSWSLKLLEGCSVVNWGITIATVTKKSKQQVQIS